MSTYNGFVSSLIKGSSTGGENAVLTGISTSTIASTVPAKFFNSAIFAVQVSGVSGTFSCQVVGAVGGATFMIAGQTGIASNGTTILGTSFDPTLGAVIRGTPGAETGLAVPRPSYVSWASAEDGSGFTGSVFMAGEYN